MPSEPFVVIHIGRRAGLALVVLGALLAFSWLLPDRAHAQKTQENYKEKFNIAHETGGVGIAASSDGKHVFIVGPQGVMVSDDFGKTGSWIQTVRLK